VLPEPPSLTTQAETLISLGIAEISGLGVEQIRAAAAAQHAAGDVLMVHPRLASAAALAPLMARAGKPGFVVTDLTDLDRFEPIEPATPPESELYALRGVDRGDAMANWSPDEALPAILSAGRSPLLISEGIQWLLQQPEALEPNRCFMTIGSRRSKNAAGYDKRTPALWISGGTGRDGTANRNAPKVGWCWAGNRHTWLGMASVVERIPLR
jgi:hypothetical protein